jgi:hypothetical protein
MQQQPPLSPVFQRAGGGAGTREERRQDDEEASPEEEGAEEGRQQAYSMTLFLDFLPAVTLCVPEAVCGARGEAAEEWVEDEEAWEGWSTDGYAAAAQAGQ